MKDVLRSFGCLIIYFLYSIHIHADIPDFIFNQIGLENGLSESSLKKILEDKKGYMWFCTEDGLNKYNGYEFVVYKNKESDPYSISNNDPRSLMLDIKGRLWVGTFEGLNIYDPVYDKFYNYRSDKYLALKNLTGNIEAIEEDATGVVWLGGEQGLYEISSLHKTPVHYISKNTGAASIIRCITSDSFGNLWIGTMDGLLQFSKKNRIFTDLRPQYGQGYAVNEILIDKNKNVWLATSDGLKKIQSGNGSLIEYKHHPTDPASINGNDVVSVKSYDDDHLLLALDGAGIDYFDINKNVFYHYTHENGSRLNCNNITTMYLDSKYHLWAGTFLNGINQCNPLGKLFEFKPNVLNSEYDIKKGIVTNFFEDTNGDFWVATDGGGLYLKKKGMDKFVNFVGGTGSKNISSNITLYLLKQKKSIWVSTFDAGLNCIDVNTKKIISFRHSNADSNSVATDRLGPMVDYGGKIWIATAGRGIDVLDPSLNKFNHFYADMTKKNALPSAWVSCFYKDYEGTLWIGTLAGLSKYLPESNTFKTYSFSNNGNKDRNFICDIIEDKYHNIWLATRGGLVRFNKENGTHRILSTDQGLLSNNIRTLVLDNQHQLWAASTCGVVKVDPKSLKYETFNYRDGIINNAFYYRAKLLTIEGKILFGCSGGYLVIDPKHAMKNPFIPPVVLTKLEVNNKLVTPNENGDIIDKNIDLVENIKLDYHQNSLTFEFAALNFNRSYNNKYSYFLEGFDNNWSSPSNQRIAKYTNLNPGTYKFKVIGSNDDGVWNKQGTEVFITINTPVWRTLWFLVFMIVLGLLILLIGYKWRTANIKRTNILLEETIQERTKELRNSNEQLESFVYKASHDIKGPLKSIIGLTTVGMKDLKNNHEAVNYFDHILSSTLKLDKLLGELLLLTKVKQATIKREKILFEEMIREIISSFENLDHFKKIDFEIDIKQSTSFYSDKNLIASIIQNLIENSIKYHDVKKENCFVNISVFATIDATILQVSDNGLGIPEVMKDKVFDMFYKVNSASLGTGLGLYIVKTTVERLGGKIIVESQLGSGSRFSIFLK